MDTPHDPTDAAAEPGLQEIQTVVLDSAELATRAASLAATAGTDMRKATEQMVTAQHKHRKQSLILLLVSGVLMLVTAAVLIGVSATLFSRLKMVDAMLIAVGKRVTELDGTMETVASVNEALQNMVQQQEQAQKHQTKVEAQLEALTKSTQGLPEATGKAVDDKAAALARQVQAMDARLAAQASSLRSLGQQMQSLQSQSQESGQKLRAEVEALARQRQQAAEAAAKAAPEARKPAAPSVPQYPRTPVPGAAASASPAGASKP